eukprot:snap_masked-scaffold_17-processed-gene-6.39-mRNA-1 protein AED:1.00 eAED:1.00 QI:0/0/0/0/1/1/2/0/116
MNTCFEVLFTRIKFSYFMWALDFKLEIFEDDYNSQEFCSVFLKIVSVSLAKKFIVFGIRGYFKSEAEFYVINKVLWNMRGHFGYIDDYGKQFENNQKLKKHYLWLRDKKCDIYNLY